jgi:DNA-binding CsgD family transcriptional regulator
MRSRLYEGEAIFRLASERLAPRAGEKPDGAWALALLSWYDMRAYIEPFETFDELTRDAQRCLEQALTVGDVQATAASQVLLGAMAEDQGDFEAALEHYQAGLRSYPPLDDAYWVNVRIALCYQALRDYPAAIRTFQVGLERSQETGDRVKTAWCLMNIGDTLIMQARPAEAEPYLDEACTLFEAVGTTLGILWCKYCSSRAALALGERARGRELAQAASRIAQQIHSASWTGKTAAVLRKLEPALSSASRGAEVRAQEAFSPRELEVLQLLKSELSGPAIAQHLVISVNTVRYHTKNIYLKLGVNTRLEALRRAQELGL